MSPSNSLDPLWDGASIPAKHWHFHRQLLARYRIVLGPGEFSHILSLIRRGKPPLVVRRSGAAIYCFRIRSVDQRVYILAKGGHLITAWPPEKRLNALRRKIAQQDQDAEHVPQ